MDFSSFVSSWAILPFEFLFNWVKAPFEYLSAVV
ncbi:hypothetical protein SAMN06295981_0751 [Corynebacterium pollutisoli]|uniref:Uncharacterized protein n=1 Tax=Corynebacterium pollutisoli TaxID=1610489 RepID=A0A1X7IL21_9CORY|nr:hypothetical protein SAMN06295981_0751 [Corynebacterium pollutisoli]